MQSVLLKTAGYVVKYHQTSDVEARLATAGFNSHTWHLEMSTLHVDKASCAMSYSSVSLIFHRRLSPLLGQFLIKYVFSQPGLLGFEN